MKRFPRPEKITPAEFEAMVKSWFESLSESLDEFSVNHLESIAGADGDFTFDVTVRFQAFGGARFLIVVECKRHKSPIKREIVQILNDKMRSVGAQKGFVIATAPFQSGAKEYALKHGIALCQVFSGSIAYIQMNAARSIPHIPHDADPYVGMFPCSMTDGTILPLAMISSSHTYWLQEFLRFPPGQEYPQPTIAE